MELILNFVLYVIPIAVIPLLLRRGKEVKSLALIIFFGASVIGEVTYLLASRGHTLTMLVHLSFWRIVISYFPMALFPLGLWAALLATGGIRLLTAHGSTYSVTLLLFGGSLVGAVTGLIGMALFSWVTAFVDASGGLHNFFFPNVLAGITAGVFSGLACGDFVRRTQRDLRPREEVRGDKT